MTGFPVSQRAQQAGGQPIGPLMHRALAQPELISLAAGFVDQHTLPVELASQALSALLAETDRGQAALQYGTTAGHRPLRQALLDRTLAADGAPGKHRPTVDQVVVTAGSNELLFLLADTLLDPGDIVLCAAPTYFVLLGALQHQGARAIGVPTDEDGVIPAAVDETLERLDREGLLPRVKAFYLPSYFDNPTSITLSAERRPELVETLARWNRRAPLVLLEDAAYRELRYAGDDLPSLAHYDESGELVASTGTFSKSFAPGVRIGWGILPKWLVEPVLNQKGNIDFGSANLNQHLMNEVLASGRYEAHVERLRAAYAAKRDAMVSAVEETFGGRDGFHWRNPDGGLYVWLTLPTELDTGLEGPLFDRALAHGMMYVPGQYFYPAEGAPPACNTMRLSFGVQAAPRIRQGIAALGRAVDEVLAQRPAAAMR
jgi:2-aminoadipate transaminase